MLAGADVRTAALPSLSHAPLTQQYTTSSSATDTLYQLAVHDVASQRQQAHNFQLNVYRKGLKRARPNDYGEPASASPDSATLSHTPGTSSSLPSAYVASPNVSAFAHNQLGQYPSPCPPPTVYQQPLITGSSASPFSAPPSLSNPSPSTTYSPYNSVLPSDQHSEPVSATPQSAVSHISNRDPFHISHTPTQQDYLSLQPRGSDAGGYAQHMSHPQYYPTDEGYASAPAQVTNASPSMSYGKSGDWPDVQWGACNYNAGNNPSPMYQDTAELYGKDASLHLKLQSLTILDNLATQIILSLAKPSLAEIEKLTFGTEDEEKQAYLTRKNLFDQTRKVYSRDSPFIDAVAIQLFTPSQQEIIRKANRATFISSLLESHDVSFFDLNEYFLEVFVPAGQRLLKWQGALLLELKTQVYISALLNSDGEVGPLLEELFPADIEEKIIARHPDAPHLVPSEQDFVERAKSRKQYLQAEPEETALQTLPRKYAWQDFLKEFATSINKNVESLLSPATRSGANPSAESLRRTNSNSLLHDDQQQSRSRSSPGTECNAYRAYSNFGALLPDPSVIANMQTQTDALAAAARKSSNGTGDLLGGPSSNKSTSNTSAARQPWRQEEEDALLAGLEEVKGPYWSRILSMYGRGGSRSEVLKDRNQIQLKDKARNLKLWYLKMGNEVPACLQGVTGELRKRGGAKVRAALGLEEEQQQQGQQVGDGGREGKRKKT